MGKRAVLFPGQGSQYVGMASDFRQNSNVAKEILEQSEDILGFKISDIMFNGPKEELQQTQITQPAIFIHSSIIWKILNNLNLAEGFAGHSLGEYTAVMAANSLSFEEALMLVKNRGEAMAGAGKIQPGTMAAVIGLQKETVEEICNQASSEGIVTPANFNSPGQIVISGSLEGVRKAVELSKEAGAKLARLLPVSGAFHSPLMESAQEKLLEALNSVNFKDAEVPIFANVSASPVKSGEEIKNLLIKQLYSPVLWEETIKNMIADGFTDFVEIGPGKVLQGLVKRIDRTVNITGIDKFEDLEAFLHVNS